jgi:hypothetical protein
MCDGISKKARQPKYKKKKLFIYLFIYIEKERKKEEDGETNERTRETFGHRSLSLSRQSLFSPSLSISYFFYIKPSAFYLCGKSLYTLLSLSFSLSLCV